MYDLKTQQWSTLAVGGTPPSPRTYHCTAAAGDKFYVYSGGHTMSDPVGDRQVHCFDAVVQSWSTLTTRGNSPKPRHGHAMTVVGDKLYVHGGMSMLLCFRDLI